MNNEFRSVWKEQWLPNLVWDLWVGAREDFNQDRQFMG